MHHAQQYFFDSYLVNVEVLFFLQNNLNTTYFNLDCRYTQHRHTYYSYTIVYTTQINYSFRIVK